jgi:hypothetical protein
MIQTVQLKEQFGPLPIDRDVTNLIDDQQMWLGQELEFLI